MTDYRSPFYREYLASDRWREKRREALRVAGYACDACGWHGRGRGGLGLEVHHLDYARLGDELPEDLRVLCDRCHAEAHRMPRPLTRRERARIRRLNDEADWLRAEAERRRAGRNDLAEENERLHRLQRMTKPTARTIAAAHPLARPHP